MLGIIITAYRQIDYVRDQINLIRNHYGHINNAHICVISTSEDNQERFESLESEFINTKVILFPNAPGSKGSDFKTKSNLYGRFPNGVAAGGNFRFQFLSARILLSIQKGLEYLSDKSQVVLHLHSDSFWNANAEDQLIDEARYMINNDIMFFGDLAEPFEKDRTLPEGFHFCPEGCLFNMHECNITKYGLNFEDIYKTPNSNDLFLDKNEYFSTDFVSIENLLGTWACWTLCKQHILSYGSIVPEVYRNKIKHRLSRNHHGEWKHLKNIGGTQ